MLWNRQRAVGLAVLGHFKLWLFATSFMTAISGPVPKMDTQESVRRGPHSCPPFGLRRSRSDQHGCNLRNRRIHFRYESATLFSSGSKIFPFFGVFRLGHRIRKSRCVYHTQCVHRRFLMVSCSRKNSYLLTFGGRYMSKTDHVTNNLAHRLDEPNSAELFTSMVLATCICSR
jgi:hypothetical protein